RDALPLRLDAPSRLLVVGRGDELLLAGADLKRERPLTRLGQQLVGLEAAADLARQPEAVETTCRQDDRVEAALAALPQPRVDVPAERLDRQLGLQREQLGAPPDRRGPDAHSRPQRPGAAERITRILPRRI